MKKNINLLAVCVCITLLWVKEINAQIDGGGIKLNSHVTEALSLPNTNAIIGSRGVGAVLPDSFKERLDDVFVVVIAAGGDAQTNDADLLAFQVGDKAVFNIRIEGGQIDVRRRIGDAWASYIIYDEVFYFRNLFTFIISPNYIAIMVDEEGAKWNIAPVLFGLNSNDGTDQFSAGKGSHVTPFFDIDSEETGLIRSVYDHTIYPMTAEYDTYAEIQLWLDDPAQKDRSVNALVADISEFVTPNAALETSIDDKLIIYPNPSSEFVMIQGLEENEIVYIYDMLGNKILKTKEKQINVSTYNQGIYFVKSESGKNVLKFVKQ